MVISALLWCIDMAVVVAVIVIAIVSTLALTTSMVWYVMPRAFICLLQMVLPDAITCSTAVGSIPSSCEGA